MEEHIIGTSIYYKVAILESNLTESQVLKY